MRRNAQLIIGIALLVAAAVLLIGFRDEEFLWFSGQPLGVVLAILGALDLLEYGYKRGRAHS